MSKFLITSTAGFIGFHLATSLLAEGNEVVGLDNINDYYDVSLKFARLNEAGIMRDEVEWNSPARSKKYAGYRLSGWILQTGRTLPGSSGRRSSIT